MACRPSESFHLGPFRGKSGICLGLGGENKWGFTPNAAVSYAIAALGCKWAGKILKSFLNFILDVVLSSRLLIFLYIFDRGSSVRGKNVSAGKTSDLGLTRAEAFHNPGTICNKVTKGLSKSGGGKKSPPVRPETGQRPHHEGP